MWNHGINIPVYHISHILSFLYSIWVLFNALQFFGSVYPTKKLKLSSCYSLFRGDFIPTDDLEVYVDHVDPLRSSYRFHWLAFLLLFRNLATTFFTAGWLIGWDWMAVCQLGWQLTQPFEVYNKPQGNPEFPLRIPMERTVYLPGQPFPLADVAIFHNKCR